MSHCLRDCTRIGRLGPALLFGLLSAACGPQERAPTSPNAESTTTTTSAPSSPSPTAAPKEAEGAAIAAPVERRADGSSTREPPKPPARERVRLHNECAKNVKLRIERQNDSDLETSLGSNTTMEERAKDGDEVWLRSEKNDTIDKIVITAAMSEVTIQSGCLKLGSH